MSLKQTHTSLNISKFLKKKGFEKESNINWWKRKNEPEEKWFLSINSWDNINLQSIPAYDILNDLCVKYGKELFGTEYICKECFSIIKNCKCGKTVKVERADILIGEICLKHLIFNHKQEAENLIMQNCIL